MTNRTRLTLCILLLAFAANAAVMLATQSTQAPRANVFEAYSAYLPGSDKYALRDCHTWETPAGFYAVCDSDATFTWIRAIGDERKITDVWFYPAPGVVKLPDLIAWYGHWSVFRRGVVYWQAEGVKAGINRWHGMQSNVSVVYFGSKS